jgi:hypothetical protein
VTDPTATAMASTVAVAVDSSPDKQSAGLVRGLPDQEERDAAEGDALPLER